MSKYEKERKFYWLQLKEDFFEEDSIDWLEEQQNGILYSHFYLKLCLKSLSSNGILIRKVGDVLIPYDSKKLSEITKTEIDTVIVAMELLKRIGLVKVLESGEIYMTQIQNMIGSKSIGAFKKQQQRQIKKESEEVKKIENGGQMSAKCPPKIELEQELKLEQEQELKLEQDKESCCDSSFNIFNYAEERNFILSPIQMQKINEDISIYSLEEVKKALDIADDNGKHTYSYVKGILEKRRAGEKQKKKANDEWEEMKKAAENGDEPF